MIKNWRSQRWQTLLNFNSKRRLLHHGDAVTKRPDGAVVADALFDAARVPVALGVQELVLLAAHRDGRGRRWRVHGPRVERLHGVLRPFLLRRLKRLKLRKTCPARSSTSCTAGCPSVSAELYEDYMASSDDATTLSSGNLLGIMNCLMQLRKVCNHPDCSRSGRSCRRSRCARRHRAPRRRRVARLAADDARLWSTRACSAEGPPAVSTNCPTPSTARRVRRARAVDAAARRRPRASRRRPRGARSTRRRR